ncbi:2-alkenal reductase [Candidatus Endobugula sertula]|uniref:2-alkenal reductase n=1 Tax=Candidatus Endobugula sertula TaxID=62101 RepID=A0A1D2QQL8_9GAMM|nr:2-alkenal reductase [Candidatus Endobugula sertula]
MRKRLNTIWGVFGWPVLLGLLIGLVAVMSQSNLRYALKQQVKGLFTLPAQQTTSYANAVSKAIPAVVNIFTLKRVNLPRNPLFDDPLFRHYFNSADIPQQQRMSSALGSGVIINKEGYLLTNNHVIAGAEEIVVSLYDGREAKAKVVGLDRETDLAVLKIPLQNLTSLVLGTPQKTRLGDVVLAIGNPFGVGQTVTQGIISATGRHGLGLNVYENFLQTDAAIHKGNSGGALIDTNGHLLGINTAILAKKDSHGIGIGFAIPADLAVSIMNDIITSGEAIRGWLGIEARTLNENVIRTYNLHNRTGVMITSIHPNGPADKAGIKAGDIVTHINQQPVGNGREGMNLIAQVRPKNSVQVTILRNGEKLQMNAIAGKRPKNI